jgi:D-3-phosphoglycerate dehydrogenase
MLVSWKILIADRLETSGLSILRAHAEVDDRAGILALELKEIIPNYDALLVRGRTRVTREIITQGINLKVIARAGVGVDNIDLEAARQRGVRVINAPVATSQAVAELTIGLLFALARCIPRADEAMKQGDWIKKELKGVELQGKTLGILGVGNIGSLVAEKAAALGMRVLGSDPTPRASIFARENISLVDPEELYARSDFITIHVPLNEDTQGLIDAKALAQMKPGVRLVCTARGGVVDESGLLRALNSGQVAAAALDVFEEEPPGQSALVCHPNLIATPHIGAQTVDAQERLAQDIAEELLAALRGETLRWKVA